MFFFSGYWLLLRYCCVFSLCYTKQNVRTRISFISLETLWNHSFYTFQTIIFYSITNISKFYSLLVYYIFIIVPSGIYYWSHMNWICSYCIICSLCSLYFQKFQSVTSQKAHVSILKPSGSTSAKLQKESKLIFNNSTN